MRDAAAMSMGKGAQQQQYVYPPVMVELPSLKQLKHLDHADKTEGPVSVIECMIGQYK